MLVDELYDVNTDCILILVAMVWLTWLHQLTIHGGSLVMNDRCLSEI
jgi:hypothetical protein